MRKFSDFKKYELISFSCVSALIFAGMILILVLNYGVFVRLGDSFTNQFNSFLYYLSFVFTSSGRQFDTIYHVVTSSGNAYDLPLFPAAPEGEELNMILSNYSAVVFNISYFKFTLYFSSKNIVFISVFILLFVLLAVVVFVIKQILFSQIEPELKGYTKTFTRINKVSFKIYTAISTFINSFIEYSKKIYLLKITVVFLFVITGTLAVVLDILSYFLLVISSFNAFYLYELLFMIVYTYWPLLFIFPLWIQIIIFYIVLDKIRLFLGVRKLQSLEEHDLDFVDNVGLVNFIDGVMGCGKTTFITDLAVTKEKLNRKKLGNNLYQVTIQFPKFNPIYLEEWVYKIKKDKRAHNTYQLIREFYKEVNKQKSSGILFGYNMKENPLRYFDGIKEIKFTSALEVYAVSFFYYSSKKSYIYSNYSISSKLDGGNFEYSPSFDFKFFDVNQRKIYNSDTVYSHILDMNAFRLEKKKSNKEYSSNYSDSIFTFGVAVFTELDKELGNMISNRRFNANDETANPLNDGSNLYFKMARHFSTINYDYYVCLFADMQRLEDLSVAYHDVAQMKMFICGKKVKNALPLFDIEFMILIIIAHFRNRGVRALNNVKNRYGMFHYFLNSTLVYFERLLNRRINHFNYTTLSLDILDGSVMTKNKKAKYHVMNAKIYSDRFSTDTHKKSVEDILLNAKGGIETDETYKSLYASKVDLRKQNSYFTERLQSFGVKQEKKTANKTVKKTIKKSKSAKVLTEGE